MYRYCIIICMYVCPYFSTLYGVKQSDNIFFKFFKPVSNLGTV